MNHIALGDKITQETIVALKPTGQFINILTSGWYEVEKFFPLEIKKEFMHILRSQLLVS